MKLAELRMPDGRAMPLHPRLAVVEADENTRAMLLIALRNALKPGGPSAGFVEVHGVLLDLDPATLALLDLEPAPALVIGSADIPVEAHGSPRSPEPTADHGADTDREQIESRREQVQLALDVVNITQTALLSAIAERDQAAAAAEAADRQVVDAIASREAAERAVEALADAADVDVPVIAEPVAPEPVVEAPSYDEDLDPWVDQRREWREAVEAAERRVAVARAEVDQAARAANPARLNQQDRDELEAAHEAVLDADDRASRRFGGSGARKKLDDARAAERTVLDRLGLDSYSDFLLRSSMGATDPSAELRLEIARSELMEAERALTDARVTAEAVPDAPPPRRAPVAAAPVVVEAAPAPVSANGEAVGRLVAATRARDDALAAEQRSYAAREEAETTLVDAEAKLVELSVRHDEAEQALAQARVRVDAALAAGPKANGHPSNPTWSDDSIGSGLPGEIDRALLAWLAARGQHPLADPLPIVLDDVYRHVTANDLETLLLRLDRLAESLHVVYMTDDSRVLHWAASLPPERAGLSELPAAGSVAPA